MNKKSNIIKTDEKIIKKLAVRLQNIYYDKKKRKKKIKNYIEFIYKHFNLIMNNLQIIYDNNIISTEYYTINILELERYLILYKNLKDISNNMGLLNEKINNSSELIHTMIDKLKEISYNIGTKNISTLIELFNNNINSDKKSNNEKLDKFIYLLDNYFVILSVKKINKNKYNETLIKLNIKEFDFPIVKNIKDNILTSFQENINGSIIYIPINNSQILIAQGYFINDPLGILVLDDILDTKYELIKDSITNLNHIPFNFKKYMLKH